jgi:hypothetical protein
MVPWFDTELLKQKNKSWNEFFQRTFIQDQVVIHENESKNQYFSITKKTKLVLHYNWIGKKIYKFMPILYNY